MRKTPPKANVVGFPAMEDEVALPVETIECVGQMGLNIGEHFGGGTEELLHSHICGSITVTPKIERIRKMVRAMTPASSSISRCTPVTRPGDRDRSAPR